VPGLSFAGSNSVRSSLAKDLSGSFSEVTDDPSAEHSQKTDEANLEDLDANFQQTNFSSVKMILCELD
jgi:hypothetical protein